MRTARLWIGIALSAAIMYWLFRTTDIHCLLAALRSANYFFLIPAVLVIIIATSFRAVRWKFILLPVRHAKHGNLFTSLVIGFMVNSLLPARLGEFVRAYVIGKKEEISPVSSFATIVAERVFDCIALVTMLLIVLIHVGANPHGGSFIEFLRSMRPVFIGVTAGMFAFIFLLHHYTEQTTQLVQRCVFWMPAGLREKLDRLLRSFTSGLQVVRMRGAILQVLLWSAVLWIAMPLSNFFILHSFGFPVPFFASFTLLVLQALSTLIPFLPGYTGSFHYATVFGLGLYGVSAEKALGAALVIHAVNMLPFVVMGLVFIWRENLSLRDVERVSMREISVSP